MAKSKSKKKIIIFSILGLIILIAVALVVISGNKEQIITVQTEKVETKTITQTVSATGTIEPEFKVLITPEVTGEIVELPVKEGDNIARGQLLIRIKPDAYIAARDRAAASLQAAKSNLAIREAELNRVTSEYSRVKELASKGLASTADLEGMEATFLSSKAQYASSQANVLQSEASLKEANEQLNKTAIFSPMNGTISQLNVELGERVLGSGFTQGTNIMTVADLSKMQATVDVDENDVTLVKIGDTTRVRIDAFRDKVFTGLVTQIANTAKTSGFGTQDQVVNFEIKIILADVDPGIRPGMSCNVYIETETRRSVVAVPIQSVTARIETPDAEENGDETVIRKVKRNGSDRPQEIVFVIKDGEAKSMNVKTGISDDYFVEINEGLEVDVEVVSGSYRAISRELKDGSKVRVDNKRGKSTVTVQ